MGVPRVPQKGERPKNGSPTERRAAQAAQEWESHRKASGPSGPRMGVPQKGERPKNGSPTLSPPVTMDIETAYGVGFVVYILLHIVITFQIR